jgi:hypothetical protein
MLMPEPSIRAQYQGEIKRNQDMTAALFRELTEAVQRYLDLMYDCDVAKFDAVRMG